MPHVYSLTKLTGRRRNENRRTVVLTVEVRRYTLIVLAVSGLASVFPTMLLAAVLGPYALFTPAVFMGAGVVLWDWRQRNGMRLRNYQAILDRRQAQNGVLYASGAPIPEPTLVMHQTVVVPATPAADQPTPISAVTSGKRSRGKPTAKDLLPV